jgi:hypothetical protein
VFFNPNYAALFLKSCFACSFANFWSTILLKVGICLGKAQNTIRLFQNLLESSFSCILKIPLLPDLRKPFLSARLLIFASQAQIQNRRTEPMAQIIKSEKNGPEVADIFHQHITDYKTQYPLWPEHRKIVS